MSQALAAALSKFTEVCHTVPSSQFTQAQRRVLDEFAQTTKALRLRSEGRGSVYQVINMDILTIHLRSLRPLNRDQLDSTTPKRAVNIANMRSSKGGKHGHEYYYFLVKSISGGVNWQSEENGTSRIFNLSEITDIAGAGVLAITEEDKWQTDQPLWLIENQALFDRLDWLPPQATGTVAYYAGHLPVKLLRWLAYKQRTTQVIIFPDYDGVGLFNYARLKQIVGNRVSFWLIPDWRFYLNKFGSNEIWRNTQREFQSAMSIFKIIGMDDGVAELCGALSTEGFALEQESVWLR